MLLSYCILLLVISCLLGAVLGHLATRRSYRDRLDAAQADAANGWAEYEEVAKMAARWKKLYNSQLELQRDRIQCATSAKTA
jgi:hypothetical protein